MEENQTEPSLSQSAPTHSDELDAELKPWIYDLLDIRVIMFLISTGVIAMTVTVLLLSGEDEAGESEPASQANLAVVNPVGEIEDVEPSIAEAKTSGGVELEVENAKPTDGGKPEVSKLSVSQEADSSFNLPIRLAKVTGCEAKSTGISRWSNDAKVKWDLAIEDRKTGYFRCFITYRSKYEGSLDICLGDRRPVTFYVLPQDSDFTEQVMVRLGKPESPTLALIAREIDPNSDLIITRIRMVPR